MKWLKKILAGGMIKNIFILLGGSGMSHVITLLSYPLLTKIYTVEDFGLFSFFLSIILPISIICTGKFEAATIIASSANKAKITIYNGVIITLLFFTFSFFILLFLVTEYKTLNKLWVYIPIIILIQGFYQSFSSWFQRNERYSLIGANKILQMTIIAIISIILGYCKNTNGLILGYIMGWLSMLLNSIYFIYKENFFDMSDVSIKKIKAGFNEFKAFPIYNAIPSLLNLLLISLQTAIILKFFSNTENGYYGFARQVFASPISLITFSFSQVLFVFCSKYIQLHGSIFLEIKKYFLILFFLGLAICLPFLFFGKNIFHFLFGNNWINSGQISSILSISLFFQICIMPFTTIIIALQRLKIYCLWQFIYFISYFILFWLPYNNFNSLVISFALLDSIFVITLLFIIVFSLKKYELYVVKLSLISTK